MKGMDIETGIAILGVWLLPSACAISKNITGAGFLLSAIVALGLTIYIV